MSRVAPLTSHAFGAKVHVRSERADKAEVIATGSLVKIA
jgi:hypothetical protein